MHKAISTKVQVLRQNSIMSIKLFDFLLFMWFFGFLTYKKEKIDKKTTTKNLNERMQKQTNKVTKHRKY